MQEVLKQRVDVIGREFGGYLELSQLLSERVLNYILQFPGFVAVVTPHRFSFDLRAFGYEVGSPYSIYNERFDFRYQSITSDGFFGGQEEDLLVVLDTPHAGFFHIGFETVKGPVVGLIWVSTRLSLKEQREVLRRAIAQAERYRKFYFTAEIFLEPKFAALEEEKIRLSFTPSIWSQRPLLDETKTEEFYFSAVNTVTIYPRLSGWYAFDYVNLEGTITRLGIEDLEGMGVQRIRGHTSGVYYIEAGENTLRRPALLRQGHQSVNLNPLSSGGSAKERVYITGSLTETIIRRFQEDSLYLSPSKLQETSFLSSASFAPDRFNPIIPGSQISSSLTTYMVSFSEQDALAIDSSAFMLTESSSVLEHT